MERLFIGGLSKDCPEETLSALLCKYGTISRLHIPNAMIGGNRGYAFADITFSTPADRNKLLSAVNGSVWRGSKLRVEKCSREPFEQRQVMESGEQVVKKKRTRPLVRHADGQMGLVDEKALERKRRDWWYRGKYGRPVAVMKMRRPDGQMMTIDPAHYKDRFEKLFGSVRPKPLSSLIWSIDAACNEPVLSESVSESESTERSESREDGITPNMEFTKQEITVLVDDRLKSLLASLDDIQPQGTFYRSKPLEELRFDWVKQRSDLRQDFKRRAKQAKRSTRNRQKLA